MTTDHTDAYLEHFASVNLPLARNKKSEQYEIDEQIVPESKNPQLPNLSSEMK